MYIAAAYTIKQEFLRTLKREYGRLIMLLQGYALIATGVRLVCTNQAGSAPRAAVLSTAAGRTLRDNIMAVFGSKLMDALQAMDVEGEGVRIQGWVLWCFFFFFSGVFSGVFPVCFM